MSKKSILLFVFIGLYIPILQAQNITRKVIASAGGTLTNGNYMLTYTIGEPITTALTAGDKMITQGFQQPGEELHIGTVDAIGCIGSAIVVPYSAIDIGGGNTFTAQLSDATGSFTSPVTIGTTLGNASGVINATIPPATIAGANYKIRVVASSPFVIGADNGVNIAINPISTNTSQAFICDSYTWPVNGQTYTSSGTYTSTVGCHTETLNLISSCVSLVNLKLYIEGYYDAATHFMRPVKYNQGLTTNTIYVDDLIVELRDVNNALVASALTTLQTDGTVVCNFGMVLNGNYYVVVKHRNAIQTWSATPINLTAAGTFYDFSNNQNKAYGNNMIELEDGVFGLYSGDINQDNNIDNLDYSNWEVTSNNFPYDSYSADLNGDGNVDNADYSIWENNANNFIFVTTP